ncbi:hypothetical protein [Thermococcus sp.]
MATIDLHNFEHKFQRQIELLEESNLPESTKELIKEFIDDALHGWGTKNVSKARAAKVLTHLRHMAEILHRKSYSFEYMTEKELKYLLKEIDKHFYERKKKRGHRSRKTRVGRV